MSQYSRRTTQANNLLNGKTIDGNTVDQSSPTAIKSSWIEGLAKIAELDSDNWLIIEYQEYLGSGDEYGVSKYMRIKKYAAP